MKLSDTSWADFVGYFNLVMQSVHENAKSKGWYDGGPRNVGEQIALIHSELSEALEGLREGNPRDKHCADYTSAEVELADVIIRIMDLSGAQGWRVAEAIRAKAKFNEGRPHKHGKGF